jgi:hypothetical protein
MVYSAWHDRQDLGFYTSHCQAQNQYFHGVLSRLMGVCGERGDLSMRKRHLGACRTLGAIS